MLPYEAVQMKEPFSFHITFCAKTFFAEFSFAWIYQKNVDEKQSLAFQKKLVCRVAVEKFICIFIFQGSFLNINHPISSCNSHVYLNQMPILNVNCMVDVFNMVWV